MSNKDLSHCLTPEQQQELDDQAAAQKALDDQKAAQEALAHERECLSLVSHHPDWQAAEWQRCKKNYFHWVKYYVWIHEPRSTPQKIPFILYDFQAEDAQWIIETAESTVNTIQKADKLCEKSRGMGWSWLVISVAVWYWLFHNKDILFGSRKLDLVDKLGDMGSLLEKARYIIRNLPEWMLPIGFDEKKHLGWLSIKNPMGGLISGESANPEFGRGDRKFFIVLDEFASWPYDDASAQACGGSTNFRLFFSTVKGPWNLFARMARQLDEDKCPIKPEVRRRHWVEHPIFSAGLSTGKDGKPTSPWYREECKRYDYDGIAAELDINYVTSTRGLVFNDYWVERHRKAGLKPDANRPIIRVWDPGGTFAVLFMQLDNYYRILGLRELVVSEAHIREVAEAVLAISAEHYPGFTFEDFGDPNIAYRQGSGAERPEFEVLRDDFDITVDTSALEKLQSKLRVNTRITAIKNQLAKNCVPLRTASLLIDPIGCPNLDRAFLEGYRYKIDKMTKQPLPIVDEQHPYEDVIDCLGIGIVSKLGLAVHSDAPKTTKVARNTVKWSGGNRRGFW